MAPKLPLKYKRDLNPDTGEKQKVSTVVTMEIQDRSQRLHTKSREVRVFNGKSVEELCYTRECFD